MLRTILLNKKRSRILLGILSFLLFIYILPALSYTIGNVFFGKIHQLYNVKLAQIFFVQAANPLFGNQLPFAHYQLCRTHFIKGDFDRALMEAKKELELFPENKRTHYMLGLIYGYTHTETLAIEEFSKFIEWKPDTWAGRNDKAWLEFRIGHIDNAIQTIQPVSHLTDNAWVQNTYGVLLMNKERYLEAKKAFLYAQVAVNSMTEKDWGKAYPGNDPRIYNEGLSAMKLSIENNLKLLEEKVTR